MVDFIVFALWVVAFCVSQAPAAVATGGEADAGISSGGARRLAQQPGINPFYSQPSYGQPYYGQPYYAQQPYYGQPYYAQQPYYQPYPNPMQSLTYSLGNALQGQFARQFGRKLMQAFQPQLPQQQQFPGTQAPGFQQADFGSQLAQQINAEVTRSIGSLGGTGLEQQQQLPQNGQAFPQNGQQQQPQNGPLFPQQPQQQPNGLPQQPNSIPQQPVGRRLLGGSLHFSDAKAGIPSPCHMSARLSRGHIAAVLSALLAIGFAAYALIWVCCVVHRGYPHDIVLPLKSGH